MEPNPYQAPQTASEPRLPPNHRCCPKCGTAVPWKRMWLWTPIWARWSCHGCGEMLRFDVRRRALMVMAVVVSMPVGVFMGSALYWFFDATWVFIPFGVLFVPCIFAIGRLEGVTLASEPSPRHWWLISSATCAAVGVLMLGASAWLLQQLRGIPNQPNTPYRDTPSTVGVVLGIGLLAWSGQQLLWWFKSSPTNQP